jgi:hypothetical protein
MGLYSWWGHKGAFVTSVRPEPYPGSPSDYAIFPPNLAWTMAFTHHDFGYGERGPPHFACHPDYVRLNEENRAILEKLRQVDCMQGSASQSLNLEASGGALLIELDPSGVAGWARCSLVPADGGPQRFLGADALDIIAGRLVAGLDAGNEDTASAPGSSAERCVLTLFEAHHSLYLRRDGGECVFRLQDGEGRTVETVLRLSDWQARRWRTLLAPLARARLP